MPLAIDLRYLKLGTAADLAAQNLVLPLGYPAMEVDTGFIKIGNGIAAYSALGYVAGDAAVIDAQTWLSTYAPLVQGVVDASINQNNQNINQYVTSILPTKVGPVTVNGLTFANQALANVYLGSLTGVTPSPTQPVLSAVPTVNDTTADEGQSITITKATWTGTQPTTWFYEVTMGATNQLVLTTAVTTAGTTVFTMPAVPAGLSRVGVVTQKATWSGGVVQASSLQFTINAVASPKPQTLSRPTFTQSGGVATGSHGLYDLAVNVSYNPHWLNASSTVIGTGTTLATPAFQGLAIRFAETPENSAGQGPEAISDPQTVVGGAAPTYVGAPAPGFVYQDVYRVGTPIVWNLGSALNNPSTWDTQGKRNNQPIAGGGAAGVTSYSYTPTSLDSGTLYSGQVIARNGNGPSETAYIPGVLIYPALSGGGGTGIAYVSSSTKYQVATATGNSVALPAGALPGDLVLLVVSVNDVAGGINTPAGWTAAHAEINTGTPLGQSVKSFWKILGSSETSPVAVTWTANAEHSLSMSAYRGATAISITPTSTTNTTSNATPISVVFPTITTTGTNKKLVTVAVLNAAVGNATTTWNVGATGLTERVHVDGDGALSQDWQWVGDMDQAAAGASGTKTVVATVTPGASTFGWIAITIALD